jgi:hypothetical protein
VSAVVACRPETDALRHYLADLPSPEELASYLPANAINALVSSGFRRGGIECASDADAKLLREYGLCDFPSKVSNGRMLTVLGMRTRRIITEGPKP